MGDQAKTITAEGMFSVSYSSTRLGNIATGFSMTLTGPSGSVTDKKTVSISDGTNSATLGSQHGITMSTGKSLNRTYEGETTVVVDPLFQLFQQMVIMQFAENSNFHDKAQSRNLGNIIFKSSADMNELFINTLAKGDMAGFVDSLFGSVQGITIKTDNTNNAPLLKALSSTGGGDGGGLFSKSMSAARRMFDANSIMTVGNIFQDYIAPFGLELYWVSDNVYSLEEPRLSSENIDPKGTITLDDIIELSSVSDPYNAPDIIIPSINFRDSIGMQGFEPAMMASIEAGIVATGGQGGTNLKVSTYNIPPMLMDPFNAAILATENAKDLYVSSHEPTVENFSEIIAGFYGAHARKSQMYTLNTGRCVCTLRADISEPYAWYTIDGEECFVSEIRHDISRTSATTTLTIAGKKDPAMQTSGQVGVKKSNVVDKEKEVIEASMQKSKELVIKVSDMKGKSVKKIEDAVDTKGKHIVTTEELFGSRTRYNEIIVSSIAGSAEPTTIQEF